MHTHDMPIMGSTATSTLGIITEYSLAWPDGLKGSTHELVIKGHHVYVTGQNNDMVARFNMHTHKLEHFSMSSAILKPEVPTGNGPHGLMLDAEGNVWVSLEFKGTVAKLDDDGKIVEEIDVNMYVDGPKGKTKINTAHMAFALVQMDVLSGSQVKEQVLWAGSTMMAQWSIFN